MPNLFEPIYLNFGFEGEAALNVVYAEIKRPKDKDKDSHNLGKTTLIRLIDFLLLKSIQNKEKFFLTRHIDKFHKFEFFLELYLSQKHYVTIKRSPLRNTKISIKRHKYPYEDFTGLHEREWDHFEISIDKAKEIIDSYLNLTVINPWSYRNGVSYFLRAQDDYRDFFQIQKFSIGKHIDWKPYLANIFGYDYEVIQKKYQCDIDIRKLKAEKEKKEAQVLPDNQEINKLVNKIRLDKDEISHTLALLDSFDFKAEESKINTKLVHDVESQISRFNQELYNISYDIEKITSSLNATTQFSLKKIQKIFEDANIYFPDQIKRDYNELIAFNQRISIDRRSALRGQLTKLEEQERKLSVEKQKFDSQRKEYLAILKEADTFKKYKKLRSQLNEKEAQVRLWEGQLERLREAGKIGKEMRKIELERDKLVDSLSEYPEAESNIFKSIQAEFHSLVKKVLNRRGNLFIIQNDEGNLDFRVEIESLEEVGVKTSQADGTTYKKLLCALFDLSVLKTYKDDNFFHFVYHDGIFEGLDDRKKIALLDVLHTYTCYYGIQCIITTIDADLPRDSSDKKIYFTEGEVVLTLNDSGPEGRLFKMAEF